MGRETLDRERTGYADSLSVFVGLVEKKLSLSMARDGVIDFLLSLPAKLLPLGVEIPRRSGLSGVN